MDTILKSFSNVIVYRNGLIEIDNMYVRLSSIIAIYPGVQNKFHIAVAGGSTLTVTVTDCTADFLFLQLREFIPDGITVPVYMNNIYDVYFITPQFISSFEINTTPKCDRPDAPLRSITVYTPYSESFIIPIQGLDVEEGCRVFKELLIAFMIGDADT